MLLVHEPTLETSTASSAEPSTTGASGVDAPVATTSDPVPTQPGTLPAVLPPEAVEYYINTPSHLRWYIITVGKQVGVFLGWYVICFDEHASDIDVE